MKNYFAQDIGLTRLDSKYLGLGGHLGQECRMSPLLGNTSLSQDSSGHPLHLAWLVVPQGAQGPAVAQALHREGFRRSCATRDGNFAPGSFSKGLKHILCIQRSQDGDTVQLFLVT